MFDYRACLHDTIMNAQTAVVGCPFDDGTYQCHTAVSEREMRTVRDRLKSLCVLCSQSIYSTIDL